MFLLNSVLDYVPTHEVMNEQGRQRPPFVVCHKKKKNIQKAV